MTARGAGKRHARPTGATACAAPTSWPSRASPLAVRATGAASRHPGGTPSTARSARASPSCLAAAPQHPHPRPRLVLVPDGAHRPRQPVAGTVAVPGQHHGYDEQYPTSTEQIRTIVTSRPAVSDTVGRVTTRNPQPEAVAAARQMLEPRVQSIADLAHAHDLVNQRRAQATAAETALAHAVTEYAERYATARRAHGWTPAELGELGFPDNQPPRQTHPNPPPTLPHRPTQPARPRRQHPARPARPRAVTATPDPPMPTLSAAHHSTDTPRPRTPQPAPHTPPPTAPA